MIAYRKVGQTAFVVAKIKAEKVKRRLLRKAVLLRKIQGAGTLFDPSNF